MNQEKMIRFGTRGSELALWQTRHVMQALQQTHPNVQVQEELIKTRGDQILHTPLPLIGGKGLFTAELETALHEKRIDCAVHSLKDLPTEMPDGLMIGAILQRENPADVLVSRGGYTVETLPEGAKVGTSSYRRASQLRHVRPDIQILDLRGNVDTRIRKALDPEREYDAIVLAYAGITRLGRETVISQILELDVMLPAPAQGAVAVQIRADDVATRELLASIHHPQTAFAVIAERAFLAGLGGGCSVPVASYAFFQEDIVLWLRGRVSAVEGTEQLDFSTSARISTESDATTLGKSLAHCSLESGAKSLMEKTS